MKRALAWGAPAAVLLLAAVLRLWNLGNPHSLVFDETFYVKDAWSLWNNGYESTWGDDPDKKFNAGITDGFTTDPSYVVHPQLGKWLIGA
ncbi:MAG: phospholipid carrier-dependent glycosyltransferase, partial [Aurantimicrobium sp.]